jgi:hypothetical protein
LTLPRLIATRTSSGLAVQTKGFGSVLVSVTKRAMAALRSSTDRNTPRLRRRLASFTKKPSTALSHDAEVGVKWNVQRDARPASLAPWDVCGWRSCR